MDQYLFEFEFSMLWDDHEELIKLLKTDTEKWDWLIEILTKQLDEQMSNP